MITAFKFPLRTALFHCFFASASTVARQLSRLEPGDWFEIGGPRTTEGNWCRFDFLSVFPCCFLPAVAAQFLRQQNVRWGEIGEKCLDLTDDDIERPNNEDVGKDSGKKHTQG